MIQLDKKIKTKGKNGLVTELPPSTILGYMGPDTLELRKLGTQHTGYQEKPLQTAQQIIVPQLTNYWGLPAIKLHEYTITAQGLTNLEGKIEENPKKFLKGIDWWEKTN